MNGVKGLVLKEVYLRRKTFLSGITGFIMLFILSVSFCLSLDYGNLKDNENIDASAAVILSYAIAGMGIMLFTMDNESVTGDVKCRWDIFERTLPLSAKKLAAVKVGLILAENLLGTAICAGLGAIIFLLAHQRLTFSFFANIAAISLLVFCVGIISRFVFIKCKNSQKAALVLTGIMIAAYGLLILWVRQRASEFDIIADSADGTLEYITMEDFLAPVVEWRDRLFPFAPLIFAAITAIGYFMFLTLYKRREK